ncbi:hypothetical protein CHU98_g1031 [Xylaria longipes]|nr:hypothetical protein CHU98_g1031 [Xylaria longipes]
MDSDSQGVQELVAVVDATKDSLWKHLCPAQDIKVFLQSTTKLQIQTTVQHDLLAGLDRLRKSCNQQNDQRIRNLVKFAFNCCSNTASDRRRERQLSFRRLDHSSLILCGLAYTVKEIEHMEGQCFAFLIDNVASFTELHGLSTHLCRENIAKVVGSCIAVKTDDPAAYKAFIQSYSNAWFCSPRAANSDFPAQVKEDSEPERQSESDGNYPSNNIAYVAGNSNISAQEGPYSEAIQQGPDVSRLGAGCITSQTSNASEAAEESRNAMGALYRYTEAAKDTLDVLGPNLSAAIHNSRQWQLEEEQRMSRTHCVSMAIPEDPQQDVLISIWVGQEMGFRISEDLGLQFDSKLTGSGSS